MAKRAAPKVDAFQAEPFDRSKLDSFDLRCFVPDHAIETINCPHSYEREGNEPIWIIWLVVEGCAPQIDTLCDTANSAVYHYGMVAQENALRKKTNRTVFVERVPANHRFASSIAYLFDGPVAYGKPKQRRS